MLYANIISKLKKKIRCGLMSWAMSEGIPRCNWQDDWKKLEGNAKRPCLMAAAADEMDMTLCRLSKTH